MGLPLRFQRSGGAVFELRNRDHGNAELEEAGQSIGFTDGAQVFAYDTGLRRRVYRMTVSEISGTARDAFQAWFDDEAQGVFQQWTLTVPQLNPATQSASQLVLAGARFLDPALEWEELFEGWWAVSFVFYTEEEGPTAPPV